MKKIVTYGKHKKREIHVNVRDKFDEISDDDNEAAFTSFVYNHRNGWCQMPKRSLQVDAHKSSFDASFSPVIEDAPLKQQRATNWYLASTPCSSKRVNPPKKSYARSKDVDLRKQIFEKEAISKNGKLLSGRIDLSDVEEHELANKIKALSIVNSSPILDDNDSNQGELRDKARHATSFQQSSVSNSSPSLVDCDVTQGELKDGSKHSLRFQQSSASNNLAEGKSQLVTSHLSSLPMRHHMASYSVCNSKSHLSFLEALTPFRLQDKSHLLTNSRATPVKFNYSVSPKEKVLELCDQDSIIGITEYFTPRLLESIRKIGEGTYGEVYETVDHHGNIKAIKIVPIDGEFEVNGEAQKTLAEISSEIAISKELSALNEKDENGNKVMGFIRLDRTVCCQGTYPKKLLTEWLVWDEEHKSENDNPECFGDDQLFLIFETESGGKSLEDYPIQNIAEARSVLHQVAAALAVAERALNFEHRDLHWGNVLIKPTSEKSLLVHIEECGEEIILTSGIKVAIIDFTLSRLEKDGCVVFCNLEDDSTLFEGQEDYQFEIYRMMQKENGNSWNEFCPKTNVMWLHYLTDKLIKHKLKRKSKKICAFFERILNYQSAFEVSIDDFFLTR